MDIESLKPLLSILFWGALFFFMMRFGCGAHMAGGHGHHGGHGKRASQDEDKDLVCGMPVTPESAGGASVYRGRTYYFCSATCRDKFDKSPDQYAQASGQGGHHHA